MTLNFHTIPFIIIYLQNGRNVFIFKWRYKFLCLCFIHSHSLLLLNDILCGDLKIIRNIIRAFCTIRFIRAATFMMYFVLRSVPSDIRRIENVSDWHEPNILCMISQLSNIGQSEASHNLCSILVSLFNFSKKIYSPIQYCYSSGLHPSFTSKFKTTRSRDCD
jgi:hypothetical protein